MKTPNSENPDFDHVDREMRIERLRRQIGELSGGEFIGGTAPGCDPAIEEAFLEQVLALEIGGGAIPFDALIDNGLVLPAPEAMDDAMLSTKLWELIRAMAENLLFLHCTDHLSDRELYAWLWHDALREEFLGFGLPHGSCHLDVLGECSEADLILQMRFYADEDERRRWAAQWPDFPMPPRQIPPFDRDRHLPRDDCPF
jgi:hypothetical protein